MYRPQPKGVVFTGNDQFEGFTIDLLNRISKDLKFDYEIILSPNNEYGGPRSESMRDLTEVQWGGIVGEILIGVNLLIFYCRCFMHELVKRNEQKLLSR